MKSTHITNELANQWADQAEAGINLDTAIYHEGPYAWLFNLVNDWDAFTRQVAAEQTTPEELISRAIETYIHTHAA